jgi:uncharacterized membrane protein YphA (DoxX/SURF4 family)
MSKLKQLVTLQGRSLVFNILFALINLTGLSFVVMGFHSNFEAESTTFISIGFILIALSIAALIVLRGVLLMSAISRVLVGGLFIVSGLVKANDPIGFAYKLEEYFEDGALAFRIKEWFNMPDFSMEYLIPYALTLSIIICIIEIILGVLTIIGGKIKFVSYSLLFMMVFFTFLTWHTANCDGSIKFTDRDTYAMSNPIAGMKIEEAKQNKDIRIISKTDQTLVVDEMKSPQCVTDCGCFGDAMKGSVGRSLSPNESMWKDLILVYLVCWIFMSQWRIKPNGQKENVYYLLTSLLVIGFFSWVFGWYFPLFFGLLAILFALWIRVSGGKYLGNYIGSALVVSLLCGIMITYVLCYDPIKDYRPYAEGSNLKEKMTDGIKGEYDYRLVYKHKKTGEKKEYSSTSKKYTDSKIWENTDWVYESMVEKVIVPTRLPSITEQFNPFIKVEDLGPYELAMSFVKKEIKRSSVKGLNMFDVVNNFNFEITQEEYSPEDYADEAYTILDTIVLTNPAFTEISLKDFILKEKTIFLLTARNLREANFDQLDKLKALAQVCSKKGIPFVMIVSAGRDEINAFRKSYNFNVPIFINDETELKAIARSIPTLLVIQNGIVIGKYPHRSTPSFDWLNKHIFKKK